MFSLNNQIAVVTGAATGIGKGIASALCEAGATVVIADLNESAAADTAASLDAHSRFVDVTKRETVRALYDSVVEEFGRLDIVCSNAGVFPNALLETMTDEQWDAMFAINTHGTFTVVQEALPHMKA